MKSTCTHLNDDLIEIDPFWDGWPGAILIFAGIAALVFIMALMG